MLEEKIIGGVKILIKCDIWECNKYPEEIDRIPAWFRVYSREAGEATTFHFHGIEHGSKRETRISSSNLIIDEADSGGPGEERTLKQRLNIKQTRETKLID